MHQGPFIERDKLNFGKFFEKIGIPELTKGKINFRNLQERLSNNPNEAESIFKSTFGERNFQNLVEQFKVNPELMAEVRKNTDQLQSKLKEQAIFKNTDELNDREDAERIAEEFALRMLLDVITSLILSG